jgi:hypothetical protein
VNYDSWIRDFLAAIGAPASQQNLDFMNAWIAKESGQYPITYGWNPLNTTQPGGGSYGGGAQGNIQFFPDYASGLAANVKTITNGYYPDLLAALRGGSPSLGASYHGLSTWGTGSLAGMTGAKPSTSSSSGSSASSSAGSASSSTSAGSTSSPPANEPPWLKAIHDMPFGIGPGIESVVSAGIVGSAAVALVAIGGLWLILGNTITKNAAGAVVKGGAKAATFFAAPETAPIRKGLSAADQRGIANKYERIYNQAAKKGAA